MAKMKIRFVRTPPAEYNGYVEGSDAEIEEKEARYLIGLGIAVDPARVNRFGTRSVSDRTEIVGADNQTEVIVTGRGANIASVHSPESDPMAEELARNSETETAVSGAARRAASRTESEGLVLQEANRHGSFADNVQPVDLANPPAVSGGPTNDGSTLSSDVFGEAGAEGNVTARTGEDTSASDTSAASASAASGDAAARRPAGRPRTATK